MMCTPGPIRNAPLAQLDRASGYEPGGRRFESCRAHSSGHSWFLLPRSVMRQFLGVILLLSVAIDGRAADREWQTGIWATPAAPARADAKSRTATIETDQFQLDLQVPLTGAEQPLTIKPGATVTFAVEGDTVYVRQGNAERACRLVKRTARRKTYGAPGAGHYIKDIVNEGLTLTLEDGSVWAIDPTQQYSTRHWQVLAGIAVSRLEQSDFDYMLNNTDDDEGAPARLISP